VSFFTDILQGGPELHRDITPSWARNLAPKEIQPGGFNPGRDWFGIDLDGSLAAEQVRKARERALAQQTAAQGQFNQSANVPIPGLTGMAPPSAVPGLLGGGLNQIQDPIGPNPIGPQQPGPQQAFTVFGPYGNQAAQMAGLLGRQFVDPNGPKAPGFPRYRPPGK
jgi:hypothetical protein